MPPEDCVPPEVVDVEPPELVGVPPEVVDVVLPELVGVPPDVVVETPPVLLLPDVVPPHNDEPPLWPQLQ